MDHSCSHRDPVFLGHVTAEADLVEAAQAADGHGQVDALTRDVLQSSDIWKVEIRICSFLQLILHEHIKPAKFNFDYTENIKKC